jgi:hypothetical protein
MPDTTVEMVAADSLEERGLTYLANILRGQAKAPGWLNDIFQRGFVHGEEVPIQPATPCRLHVGGHSFGPLFLVDIDCSAQIISRSAFDDTRIENVTLQFDSSYATAVSPPPIRNGFVFGPASISFNGQTFGVVDGPTMAQIHGDAINRKPKS